MYWLRYQMPVHLIYTMLACVGLAVYLRGLADHPQRKARTAAIITVFFLFPAIGFVRYAYSYATDAQDVRRTVIETAEWVRANTLSTDLVAAHDIGGILYFSNRKVLDMVGLADPEIMRLHKTDRTRKLLWEHLAKIRPDVIVMFERADEMFFHFETHDRAGVLQPVWSSPRQTRRPDRYLVFRCRWYRMKE